MKITEKLIGGLGVIAFLFSLVYYSIQNVWEIINWITLILGIAGIGYFLFDFYKKREKGFSTRNIKYGSNVLAQVLIVVGIVALIAFITTRRHFRSDWTEKSLYSLADQTDKIMTGLEKEVKLSAFFKSSEQKGAQDLLDEYSYMSDNLTYEFIDPDEQPQLAQKYNIKQYNTVIVESGIKRETVTELSEANLTNAIMKVTREQDKVIYFLTGHGERSIKDEGVEGYKNAADAVKNENYIVRELNLVRKISTGTGIPDSCSVLAIVRPQSNFFPGELDSIKNYINKGGKAIILLDPGRQNDIAEFISNYHVSVGNNMVLDASGMGQLFGAGPAMPLVTNYSGDIAITKDFNVMTFYPQATSVMPMEEKGGFDIKEILKTSANSWAESNLTKPEASFDEGEDIAGPVSLAVLIEKTEGDSKLALAVFGDSDFAKNGYWRNQGNADLFLNTVNYLAEEEDLISIRPKEVDDRRVTLTQADVKTIFYLVVIAIPLLVIIGGVVFYIKRGK